MLKFNRFLVSVISVFFISKLFAIEYKKNNDSEYMENYRKTDIDTKVYISPRIEVNFQSWKNIYNSDEVGYTGGDDFRAKPILGGSLALGTKLDYYWRAELEMGHFGSFKDFSEGIGFNLSIPYGMMNFLYNLDNRVYFGIGTGIALINTEITGDIFKNNTSNSQSEFAPMGALMFGYSHQINNQTYLDFRYRISLMGGSKQKRYMQVGIHEKYFENTINMITDFGLGIALRYEF